MPTLVATLIEHRKVIQPNHATPLGTCHGGNVMKWMDEVGGMSAMRFAGEAECPWPHPRREARPHRRRFSDRTSR